MQKHERFEELARFITKLPETVQRHERVILANAWNDLRRDEYESVREMIRSTEFVTIREGERTMHQLWYRSYRLEEEARLGRTLTDDEKKTLYDAHPIPGAVNFGMKGE